MIYKWDVPSIQCEKRVRQSMLGVHTAMWRDGLALLLQQLPYSDPIIEMFRPVKATLALIGHGVET
jgi:hypothetical protein